MRRAGCFTKGVSYSQKVAREQQEQTKKMCGLNSVRWSIFTAFWQPSVLRRMQLQSFLCFLAKLPLEADKGEQQKLARQTCKTQSTSGGDKCQHSKHVLIQCPDRTRYFQVLEIEPRSARVKFEGKLLQFIPEFFGRLRGRLHRGAVYGQSLRKEFKKKFRPHLA